MDPEQIMAAGKRHIDMLDNPDRYKLMAGMYGGMGDVIGGFTFIGSMVAAPLVDIARSLDRIAKALEAPKKEINQDG